MVHGMASCARGFCRIRTEMGEFVSKAYCKVIQKYVIFFPCFLLQILSSGLFFYSIINLYLSVKQKSVFSSLFIEINALCNC